jgi:PD-(D/E)XK nuclease superfamily
MSSAIPILIYHCHGADRRSGSFRIFPPSSSSMAVGRAGHGRMRARSSTDPPDPAHGRAVAPDAQVLPAVSDLEAIAADLRERGKLDLAETFIDGSFASAKKGHPWSSADDRIWNKEFGSSGGQMILSQSRSSAPASRSIVYSVQGCSIRLRAVPLPRAGPPWHRIVAAGRVAHRIQGHPVLAQVLTYLKIGRYPTGLLINFNVTALKRGPRRLAREF